MKTQNAEIGKTQVLEEKKRGRRIAVQLWKVYISLLEFHAEVLF